MFALISSFAYYFVVFCKHRKKCIRKKWLYGFPEFFVVRNTFDTNIIGRSDLTQKIPLLLIIVVIIVILIILIIAFIRLFLVEIIFEFGSKHYRFSERFSRKGIVVKT